MPSLNTILFLSENGFRPYEGDCNQFLREDPIFGNVFWIADRGCASYFQWIRPAGRYGEDYTFSIDRLEKAYERIDRTRLSFLRNGGPTLKKCEREWLLRHGFKEVEPQEDEHGKDHRRFRRRGLATYLRERGWGYWFKNQEQREKEERYRPTPMVDDRHFATLHDLVVSLEWMDLLHE